MSNLASKLSDAPAPSQVRRGPANQCLPLYGPGDMDDWEAVTSLREQGHDWRSVQAIVDEAAGVERPLHLDKFRYHWNRKCFCWASEDRR